MIKIRLLKCFCFNGLLKVWRRSRCCLLLLMLWMKMQNQFGAIALHAVVYRKYQALIPILLDGSAKFDARDACDYTPLIVAVITRNLETFFSMRAPTSMWCSLTLLVLYLPHCRISRRINWMKFPNKYIYTKNMMYRTLTWTLARHWGVIADDCADELLIEATKSLDQKDLAMKHYFFNWIGSINILFFFLDPMK